MRRLTGAAQRLIQTLPGKEITTPAAIIPYRFVPIPGDRSGQSRDD